MGGAPSGDCLPHHLCRGGGWRQAGHTGVRGDPQDRAKAGALPGIRHLSQEESSRGESRSPGGSEYRNIGISERATRGSPPGGECALDPTARYRTAQPAWQGSSRRKKIPVPSYSMEIHRQNGQKWPSFGKTGRHWGDFYHPWPLVHHTSTQKRRNESFQLFFFIVDPVRRLVWLLALPGVAHNGKSHPTRTASLFGTCSTTASRDLQRVPLSSAQLPGKQGGWVQSGPGCGQGMAAICEASGSLGGARRGVKRVAIAWQ